MTYLCVADVQITDRKIGKSIGRPTGGQASGDDKVQLMRMVGHVRQKSLDIPEATPLCKKRSPRGLRGCFSANNGYRMSFTNICGFCTGNGWPGSYMDRTKRS